MEILILIIIGGIILYLVFEDKTEKKYKKGITALRADNLDLSEQYFKEISEKHAGAKSKLEEITFKRGEISEHAGDLEKAYEYFSLIQTNNSKAAERLVEIDYTRGLSAKKNGDLDTAYKYFSKIASNSQKAFFEASKIDFKRGVTAEFSKTYSLAKEFYLKSSLYRDDVKVCYGSICRNLICDLKNNSLPTEKEVSEIYNSPVDEKFKNDFLYRYAVNLIKSDKLTYASEIINNKFDNSLPEVEDLGSFIYNYKKAQLKNIIQEINNSLFTQESNSLLIETLYNKIEIHKNIIAEFPEYSSNIFEIQKNLFGKLLSQYILEQEFEKCLEHIISFPKFYEKIELLKNAAICCIRLALGNKISEINYKKIIPIWLTAIYNDDIFINSLETTSWDDEYTFTFGNVHIEPKEVASLGKYSSFLFDIKLENINREKPSETNIPIGSAQRELLQLFESSLNHIQPEKVNKTIHKFYIDEKWAIDSLSKSLGYDILLCTPEFAKQFKISKSILKFLGYKYDVEKSETILDLGAKYISLVLNKENGVILQESSAFEKYASSLHYLEIVSNYIKKRSDYKYEEYKDSLIRYESIKIKFEEQVLRTFSDFANSNDEDEKLIELMNKVFKVIPTSERIGYFIADYTTTYCIKKIDSKSISETNVLEFLVNSISVCPENHRTAKNLAIFISIHLVDYTFNNKVKSLIPKLRDAQSECLYESLQAELLPLKNELNELMRKPNINYTRVNQTTKIIDELINSVAPF